MSNKIEGLNLPDDNQPGVLRKPHFRQEKPMNKLARKEIIDQLPCARYSGETAKKFESLTDFLDHVELGVRDFVRQILQRYAEDKFLRYIGAKRYERTPLRQDRRNGSRIRQLETRFGIIEDLRLPRGRKSGRFYAVVAYWTILFSPA